MNIQENVQLKTYNTFGVKARASRFAIVKDAGDLTGFIRNYASRRENLMILNGGSNVLFTRDFEGILFKLETQGITKAKEDQDYVWLQVAAGVNWHEFVTSCIRNNLGGVENLSLIPGNTGAAPIQNIGAYGVEQKDVFEELEALNIHNGEIRQFDAAACRFGYRDSIFKTEERGNWIVLRVTYRLRKNPEFNTTYGAIQSELEKMGVDEFSVQSIGQAVCNIRSSKLPDTEVVGNAGSFFKNPLVPKKTAEELKAEFPQMVAYEADEYHTKLAAGWLIDTLGWKGYREGDAGVWKSQALVLVNYGNATGADILRLAEKIQDSVHKRFGILLEPEVNIV
ncbi:MAG: UDP-N-acetylmuramate dehydrogenase [Bacteroidales bacterium]